MTLPRAGRISRLFVISGPSGVGKSSLVRAGLAASRPQGWAALVCTPGAAAFRGLGQALLPALPLGAGRSFQVPVFASGQGTSTVMTVTVSGSESVTVPAGTFDAWKVEVSGGQVPVTFWVSRSTPRVVKMGFAGAPMAFELVK